MITRDSSPSHLPTRARQASRGIGILLFALTGLALGALLALIS